MIQVSPAPEGTDERKPPSLGSLVSGLMSRVLPGSTVSGGSPQKNLILEREHPILSARGDQLKINLLALDGGRPYIEERLSRFAGEHKIGWEGGTRKDGSSVTGRKDQAHCIPYPGRIAEKVNQYVFSEPATRVGADEQFLLNVSRDGTSAHFFFRQLNSYLTACGWAWVGVDMPRLPSGGASLAEVERRQIRPYWVLYAPTDVVEWAFDEVGRLKWVLTETTRYENSSPGSPGVERTVRELWEPGKRTAYWYDEGSKQLKSEVVELTLKSEVPFVLVGRPSAKPHLFDSIEGINRTILDLESVSRQNYFDRCFPQMYLPASVMNAMSNLLKGYSAEEMIEMVIGLNFPILLEEGDPTPGYVMPGSGDLKGPGEESLRLKREMFECVGMMLRAESRSAQSAEAKSWDHLDVEQVLKDRANLLAEAEQKLVALSKAWDQNFKEYTPNWPTRFNVRDFAADMASLIQLGQIPMPPEMGKELLTKLLEVMSKMGLSEIPDERLKELREAIGEFVDQQSNQLESVAGNSMGAEA